MLDSGGHGDPAPYTQDLLALDADGVHRLFADLGFPHYRDQLAGERAPSSVEPVWTWLTSDPRPQSTGSRATS